MNLRGLNAQYGTGLEILRKIGTNVAACGLPVIVGRQHTGERVYRADRMTVIVDRTALSRPPAQNQHFEIRRLVQKVPRVVISAELDKRFDFWGFGFQIEDKLSQIRKFQVLCGVLQLIDCSGEVHSPK